MTAMLAAAAAEREGRPAPVVVDVLVDPDTDHQPVVRHYPPRNAATASTSASTPTPSTPTAAAAALAAAAAAAASSTATASATPKEDAPTTPKGEDEQPAM